MAPITTTVSPHPEGHFTADLGFEHFFTGHAGLLAPGAASNPFESSDHPIEHTFRQWMTAPGNLKEYHAKTRENIQQLFNWVESIERALARRTQPALVRRRAKL